jgi:hypothetical protein
MTKAQRDFLENMRIFTSSFDFGDILPSLVTAQAILESNWGKSGLATKGNALFGIKATTAWKGKVYSANTQECYDGVNFVTVNGAFRAYDNWGESILDYVKLIAGATRYKAVIGEKCYKNACYAIHKAGYATDPKYPSKLINLIETYSLTDFDPVNYSLSEGADIPGTVRIRLDGLLYRPKADNIGGSWYINIPGLEFLSVPLRGLLILAGFGDIYWDDATDTVTAVTAPKKAGDTA